MRWRTWPGQVKEWWGTWYLRSHGNWHKHPKLARAICWLGRHDYEAERILPGRVGVELHCFVCGKVKHSSFIRH